MSIDHASRLPVSPHPLVLSMVVAHIDMRCRDYYDRLIITPELALLRPYAVCNGARLNGSPTELQGITAADESAREFRRPKTPIDRISRR